MKLKWKALLGVYVLILAGGLIQSCCEEEFIITGGGELIAYDSLGLDVDTVRGEFTLSAQFNVEQTIASSMLDDLSKNAYATSCAVVYRNSLAENSFTLTLDKSFIYQGDTIASGENLLLLDHIIPRFETGSLSSASASFQFMESFFEDAEFAPGFYTFMVDGSTTDDVQLNNTIELYINL